MAAAWYLRRAGHTVTVYDRMEKAGGVLRYGIPHYRLPKDILDRVVEAMEKMGVEFRMGTEIGRDISLDSIADRTRDLVFATGAWKQPVIGLGGEELTEFGLNFLVEVNTYLQKAIGNEGHRLRRRQRRDGRRPHRRAPGREAREARLPQAQGGPLRLPRGARARH